MPLIPLPPKTLGLGDPLQPPPTSALSLKSPPVTDPVWGSPPNPPRLEAAVQNLSIHTKTSGYLGEFWGGPWHPRLLGAPPCAPPSRLLPLPHRWIRGGARGGFWRGFWGGCGQLGVLGAPPTPRGHGSPQIPSHRHQEDRDPRWETRVRVLRRPGKLNPHSWGTPIPGVPPWLGQLS